MKINIIIVGGVRTGKTTIGQEIEQHLESFGIRTDFVEGNTPAEPRFTKEQREKNLQALVEKGLEVEIVTCQTARRARGRRE